MAHSSFWSIIVGLFIFLYAYTCSAYVELSEAALKAIPRPGKSFDIHSGELLAPILIPRVSGTEGNEKVRNFFAQYFAGQLPKWKVTYQNSTSKTPVTGERDVPFVNMIIKRDPPWASEGQTSYLTLVAHYDSKISPPGFIGATDSAAPCAMLLHVAKSIETAIESKWSRNKGDVETMKLDPDNNKGVQILLLDGEEAFQTWTATDSIYGARSLAVEWETVMHPAMSTYHNPLRSIEMFVLLDLLGAPSPRVPSYFKLTHWIYQKMARLEERMRELKLLYSSPNHKKREDEKRENEPMFFNEARKKETDQWLGGYIGDDHEPFLARGVDIFHIIASPFPRVWHLPEDNGDHLHIDTTEDWAVLMTAFTAEYMELVDFMPQKLAIRDEL
ncbi:MAG: hypothetical protein GOMPHAMPRED_001755 [Gomphillus americanus]|uniref:Peptide hydrolase n=1 Tax=Gomphillus americanus TaxID=1940652 RepID=A0A8H3FC61_9LECA|nr:MAG: hypothetical protein GOMPHAMPRED_001755 [Gomphillus americanus]